MSLLKKFEGVCLVYLEGDWNENRIIVCGGNDVVDRIEEEMDCDVDFSVKDGLIGRRIECENEFGGFVIELDKLKFDDELLIKVSECGSGFKVVEMSDDFDLYGEEDVDIEIEIESDFVIEMDSMNDVVLIRK